MAKATAVARVPGSATDGAGRPKSVGSHSSAATSSVTPTSAMSSPASSAFWLRQLLAAEGPGPVDWRQRRRIIGNMVRQRPTVLEAHYRADVKQRPLPPAP